MNDINNLDPNDEGLRAVMGDKFQDLSGSQKPEAKKPVQATDKKPCRKALDASWEPVKTSPTQLERLKSCGKNALIYGSLCLLVFYWQQTGQMLPSAAVPCMMACSGGAMWCIGRACR